MRRAVCVEREVVCRARRPRDARHAVDVRRLNQTDDNPGQARCATRRGEALIGPRRLFLCKPKLDRQRVLVVPEERTRSAALDCRSDVDQYFIPSRACGAVALRRAGSRMVWRIAHPD